MKFTCLYFLFLYLLFSTPTAQAQQHFELSLANDNDVYLFNRSDRYYTNGISLGFLMSLPNDDKSSNTLEFKLKHRLYNGLKMEENNLVYLDRPFTAIFSLDASWSRFVKRNRVFRFNLIFEQQGPKAKGEEIQDFIHQTLNLYEVTGWDSQLPNSFGLDLAVNYEEDLFSGFKNKFGLSSSLSAVVGMNNVNFQVGIPIRLGRFRDFSKSVFSKGHLNSNERNDEFFFYYKPTLTYQIKNSSIREFDSLNDQVTNNTLVPFLFTHQVGAMLAKGKSTLGLSYFRYNTELKKMKYNHHQYVSIQYSRRF